MKKTHYVFLTIVMVLIGLVYSCASFGVNTVNDPSKAGIIVQFVDGARREGAVNVFINDKKIGIIELDEIKGYRLPNGHHTIHFTRVYDYSWYLGSSAKKYFTRTETYRFEVNNNRLYFALRAYGPHLISLNYKVEPVVGLQQSTPPVLPASSANTHSPSTNLNAEQAMQRALDTMDSLLLQPSLVEQAIQRSFDTINSEIPNGSTIAILNSLPDDSTTIFIFEELTSLFVSSRNYIVVDRQTLETIRQEQQFQMSGEVSDESALSIGNFLGADVIITGSISGSGDQRRLRLRALDVKTTRILAMPSERI